MNKKKPHLRSRGVLCASLLGFLAAGNAPGEDLLRAGCSPGSSVSELQVALRLVLATEQLSAATLPEGLHINKYQLVHGEIKEIMRRNILRRSAKTDRFRISTYAQSNLLHRVSFQMVSFTYERSAQNSEPRPMKSAPSRCNSLVGIQISKNHRIVLDREAR